MQNVGNGVYQMSKVDLIKFLRTAGSYAIGGNGIGLKEAKDATETYILRECEPRVSEAITVLNDAIAHGNIGKRQLTQMLGICKDDLF